MACSAAAAAADADALFAAALTGTDGRPAALAEYRGKPLLVNFWARWCPPCRSEMPELAALQAEYGAQGLTVLGIAIDDDAAAVREFLAAYDIGYPVALGRDTGIGLMQSLGNASAGLPFTLAIDREGGVRLRKLGAFGRDDFHGIAQELMR